VRPLPFVPATAPTAITRRHFVQETTADGVPILTLIGGKLTTCRSFAESVTDRVLQLIGQKRRASTHDRPVPGAEGYPANDVERERLWQSIARRHNLSVQQVAAVWKLLGTRTEEALAASPSGDGVVADTDLPASFVRWVIANEWVTCLLDLVERRLLLLYEPSWTVQTIADLARLLVEAGRPAADVAGTVRHLSDRYGLALPESAPPFDA
jgi:glycerol-3-phosphate dehydrogenase